MSFTAGVISWKLPETANKPLPEDLSDLEEKVKDSRVMMVTPLSEDKVKLLEADISEKHQQMVEDGVEVWYHGDNTGFSNITYNDRPQVEFDKCVKNIDALYDLTEKWTLSVWMNHKTSMSVSFTYRCTHCLSCLLRIKLSSSSSLSSAAILPWKSVVFTKPSIWGLTFASVLGKRTLITVISSSPDTWVCIYVEHCSVFVPRFGLTESLTHYTFIEIMWIPYHPSI